MQKWFAIVLVAVVSVACQRKDTSSEGAGRETADSTVPGGEHRAGSGSQVPEAQKFTESGTVADASNDKLTIRRATGDEVEIDLRPDTRIMRDGQQVQAGQLQEGTEVRASYVMQGDERVAEHIEVMGNAFPDRQGPADKGGDMQPVDEKKGGTQPSQPMNR